MLQKASAATPYPAGGAYSAAPDPLAGGEGVHSSLASLSLRHNPRPLVILWLRLSALCVSDCLSQLQCLATVVRTTAAVRFSPALASVCVLRCGHGWKIGSKNLGFQVFITPKVKILVFF